MRTQTLMNQLNPRLWMAALSGVAATGLMTGCMTSDRFHGEAGLQLYSLRAQFPAHMPETMDEIHSWGVKYVETAGTYGKTPEEFHAALVEKGLDAVSGHFPFDAVAKDPEAVAEQAEKLGLKYVGCAWVPHSEPFDEATCRKAIDVFNKAGAVMAAHHMTFFYHTHGYEFQPYQDGTLFDLLLKETNPQQVKLEMDIFWICHAGQDPVKLLDKYAGRWELMHLKDMRTSTPTGLLTGHSDVKNDVALGEGKLPIADILRAAERVGVKWYFLEDESPTSEEQIPRSLAYLRASSYPPASK